MIKPNDSHPYQIQDHEAFALNDPNQAWQVKSGHIALCRVALKNGKPTGQRQCFFTVNPGEVVFGVSPQDSELVAIALEPTVVVPV
ncbi:MAG: hypothetical protein AAFV72_14190 [Cyanobacteria bacterium J06635_1]